MSCICNSPVRPEFKDSYNDLLDKPKINGVTLSGNLTAADLGIKAGAQFKIVAQLPVTDIDEATVYLVPVQVGQTDNIYQEWIYINNKWEKIGEPINIDVGIKTKVISSYRGRISYEYLITHNFDVTLDLNTLNEIRTNGDPLEDNTLYIPCPMTNGASAVISGPDSYTTEIQYLSPRAGGQYITIGDKETIITNMFWVVDGRVWFTEISYTG
jgi:hypothetical protein